MADARLPKNLTFPVGIDGVDHAGFLSRDQSTPSVWQIDQYRRRTKVEVRSPGLRAVILKCRIAARDIKGIAFGHLARPESLSGIEIEREKGIGGTRRRIGIAIPCGDINRARARVDRRRSPNARA